jgi:CheY-like chemotaxis protein
MSMKVAVVDDDQQQREITGFLVEEAGYEPVILQAGFPRVEDLVSSVQASSRAAICDHRLSHRNFAAFDGSEAVAKLVQQLIPSVLVTQFSDMDADVSIRRWRRYIPVLLQRDEANAEQIAQALETCEREIRGDVPPWRKPRQTLLRVDARSEEDGCDVVDAFIQGWRGGQRAVRFPLDLVPVHLRDVVVPGARLLTKVNIGADSAEEIYLAEFELALPEELLV